MIHAPLHIFFQWLSYFVYFRYGYFSTPLKGNMRDFVKVYGTPISSLLFTSELLERTAVDLLFFWISSILFLLLRYVCHPESQIQDTTTTSTCRSESLHNYSNTKSGCRFGYPVWAPYTSRTCIPTG